MKKGDEIIIDVTSLSTDGKGISKTDEGFVIFSDNTLPGDKVKLKINRSKKNLLENE